MSRILILTFVHTRRDFFVAGPARGLSFLSFLSFCHRPPGAGFCDILLAFRVAGTMTQRQRSVPDPWGEKMAVNCSIFRTPGHHDRATASCHGLLWAGFPPLE